MNFIKSQVLTFLLVVFITGSTILFYTLNDGNDVEILYPVMVAVLFYAFYLAAMGYRFYCLNKLLNQGKSGMIEKDKWNVAEFEQITDTVNQIHQHYIDELHATNVKNQNDRRLIAQAVHNVKLPVSVVKLITEELRNDSKQDDYESLSKVAIEMDKTNLLLDQILGLIRLGEFEKDYIIEKIDLFEEVKSFINSQKDLFIYYHIFPELDEVRVSCHVLTDRKWNRLILMQILSNALKYSALKPGADRIKFHFEISEKSVVLKIIDEGIGIESWDMERLFQPFFTGENGRKTGNSSGIGLYIANTIANALGHKIDIESVPNEGTTVSITYLTKL